MKLNKEKLKKEWDRERASWKKLSEEDSEYIKEELLKTYKDVLNFKPVEKAISCFEWVAIHLVMFTVVGLMSTSIFLLTLAHPVIMLVLFLLDFIGVSFVYYWEFLGGKESYYSKRIDK